MGLINSFYDNYPTVVRVFTAVRAAGYQQVLFYASGGSDSGSIDLDTVQLLTSRIFRGEDTSSPQLEVHYDTNFSNIRNYSEANSLDPNKVFVNTNFSDFVKIVPITDDINDSYGIYNNFLDFLYSLIAHNFASSDSIIGCFLLDLLRGTITYKEQIAVSTYEETSTDYVVESLQADTSSVYDSFGL